MPRKPAVPHHEMANAILLAKGDILDVNNCIVGPTGDIWRHLASKLDNKVAPRYLYQYVKQNRHEIHRVLGLSESRSVSSPVYSTSPVSQMDMGLYTDEDIEMKPEKTFKIVFTPAEWRTIQPVEMVYKRTDRTGSRVRMVLPQHSWANALVEKLWESHKLPCPYTIVRGHVTSGEDSEYIKISALCKECGACATGVTLSKPQEGESVSFSWRAPDTRDVPHHRSRWLSGSTRRIVGKDLKRNCASVYRRELAFLKMDQGDSKPPTLWPNSVLRKAKQEYREEELGTKGHGTPIESLVQMKYSAKYAAIIHDIGIDKFFVHYYSAAQLLLYKKHRKTNYTKLSIDATGTLVKKINRPEGMKSGHIFLYEGVLTSIGKAGPPQNLPVVQMLSEKHDANSIIFWLNEWRRAGAPVPQEVVVDNSAALKNAVARVFAGMDLKSYVDQCFKYLREGRGDLPQTFIRLDIAHYINAACRWRIWADPSKSRIKEFYIRCLGTLVNAQTFKEFESQLRSILTVALSPCRTDGHGKNFPMQECLLRLTEIMKNGLTSDLTKEVQTEKAPLADNEEVESTFLSQWITEIEKSISLYDDPEGDLNPYYLPEAAKEFCRMAKEFVLWSSVLASDFGSPFIRGTSSPVESSFSDLKCNILKGESKPLKANNFVATHINAIEGACRMADMTPIDDIHMCTKSQSGEQSPNDLNELENWRGLGVPKRSKYLSAFPGAEIAVASNNFKAATHGVLRNGTGKAVGTPDGTVLIINNTCSFDALCHIITNAYMTFASYRELIKMSNNSLIKTAYMLAHEGPSTNTYTKRAESLASVLEPKNQLLMPITRRRSLALEYDAFGNVTNLLKKMIPPHTSQEVFCEVENHPIQKYVVDPNSKTLVNLGLAGLNQSLTDCDRKCSQCTYRYGGHIFVDLEFLSDELFPRDNCNTARLYALGEIPKELSLGNDIYRVSGVVAYAHNHYIAYCYNIKWRKYDDLAPKDFTVEESTKIWPSLLMYVK